MKTISSNLINHPLFKGMTARQLEMLSEGAVEIVFEPGQVVFHQGQPANAFYLIEEGAVALEATAPKQYPIKIQTLGGGDILGWSWLFPPFVWNFQARARERCRLLRLDGGHLLAATSNDPDFGYELIKRLAQVAIQRLQTARRKLLEFRQSLVVPRDDSSGVRCDSSNPVHSSREPVSLTHPFFEGLAPEHLKLLSNYAMYVQFKAGAVIFREGEIANRFYLIEEGKVVLESHLKDVPSVQIQTIGAGDVLGWSWLFPPYYWNFDARALAPTSAIFLYGTRLREDCETNHSLGVELLRRMVKVIIQRLQATRQELLRLSPDSPVQDSGTEPFVPMAKTVSPNI